MRIIDPPPGAGIRYFRDSNDNRVLLWRGEAYYRWMGYECHQSLSTVIPKDTGLDREDGKYARIAFVHPRSIFS